jgi:hypothetical protein
MRLLRQVVLVSLLSVPAWSTTLYSNGAVNGATGGLDIDQPDGREVTDSFVISATSTVTQVSNLGLWTNSASGDSPLELSWVISTLPDGGGTVQGSASGEAFSSIVTFGTSGAFTVFSVSFAIPSVTLTPGTYYLELFNALSNRNGFVGWDENSGTSTADSNTYPTLGTPITEASESFEIDGTSAVPEPASVATLGAGLGFLAWMSRRRKRK